MFAFLFPSPPSCFYRREYTTDITLYPVCFSPRMYPGDIFVSVHKELHFPPSFILHLQCIPKSEGPIVYLTRALLMLFRLFPIFCSYKHCCNEQSQT